MQSRQFVLVILAFISFCTFAEIGENDGTHEKDFLSRLEQKNTIKAEQDKSFLVQETYEAISSHLPAGTNTSSPLGNIEVSQMIKVLLRGDEFIDYRYWIEKDAVPNRITSAVEQVFDTMEVNNRDTEVDTKKYLRLMAVQIVRITRKSYLKPILDKYTENNAAPQVETAFDSAITDFEKLMLIEVLLNYGDTIDTELWTRTEPVNMVEEAVDETMRKLELYDRANNERYEELLRKLTKQIISNSVRMEREVKLARFADGPGSNRRALKKINAKEFGNVVDINKAIDKARK